MSSNIVVRFVSAVFITYVVAVFFVSQFNANNIAALGVDVSFTDRANAVIHDLVGMLDLYLPIIAVGFLVAFLFTRFVLLRFVKAPAILYPLAGFVALATVHLTLKAVFGMTPVAPTATLIGLLVQCLAGAVGGFVFFKLAPKTQT